MTAIDISREACERLANVGFGYDLTKDDRAMILALRAALDAERWRSIATEPPPMDGTRFWAFEAGRQYECWWQDDFSIWAGWQDDWGTEPEPAHWRPLPEPPEVM